MQAIILAAGKGTRLHPLTETLPKPLIPVQGTPILERILDSLPEKISEVIIVIGYKGEAIQTYLGDTFKKIPITYVQQSNLSGTYGALLSAKEKIKAGSFLVMGADDIQDKEALSKMVEYPLSFGVHHKTLPTKEYLIVDIHHSCVRGMRRPTDIEFENPQPMATGIYVLNEKIWECEKIEVKGGEYGLPQTMRPLLLEYDIVAVEMPQWIQINSHEELAYAEAEFTKIALPLQ